MQFLGFLEVDEVSQMNEDYINRLSSRRLITSLKKNCYYCLSYGNLSQYLFDCFSNKKCKLDEVITIDKSDIKECLKNFKYFICSDVEIFNLDEEINLQVRDTIDFPDKVNVSINSLGHFVYQGREYLRNEAILYLSRMSNGSYNIQDFGGSAPIKYFGNIGTSGYAKSCRSITQMLSSLGIEYIFEATTAKVIVKEDIPNLSRFSTSNDYSTIIIHEVPCPYILTKIREEKRKSKKIVLITVWETLLLPPEWRKVLTEVDVVLTPSQWNLFCFKEINPNSYYLPHPVEEKIPSISTEEKYIFYTINEWTGRKHIDDVLEAFQQEFQETDNVALIIKTFNIKQEDINKLIYTNLDIRVILERYSEEEISRLHDQGCAFISLASSEGMGYSLCEAAMKGKPIISTSFGAQTEYIKGVYYVSTHLENCKYCDKKSSFHSNCDEKCRINNLYSPKDTWGRCNIEDVKKTMRYLYSNNIRSDLTSRNYLLYYYNSHEIGKKFLECIRKLC